MAYDGTLKFDTSMDASGFQKGTSRLNDIAKGLTVFKILEAGFKVIVDSVDAAVTRYDTLNRFPKIMEQMGYSADESAAATKKLSDGIQGLPTTLDGIVSSTKQLVIATGSLDTGVDSALALNNAFLASGATMAEAERGLVQYTQMLSSGKVDMQSWRTLNETMTYALQKTAESFGFAGSSAKNDLYAALRDGDITFTQFNDRIIELNDGVGGFAELAQTSSGGIRTAWTNLKTAVVRNVANIIEAVDDMLFNFGGIVGVLESAKTVVNTVFSFIGNQMNWLLPIIATVVTALGTLGTALVMKSALSAAAAGMAKFMAMLAVHPVLAIASAIAGLAVGITLLISSANSAGSSTEQLVAKLSSLRAEIDKTNEMDTQIRRYEALEQELKSTSLTAGEAAGITQELNEVRQWIIDNSNGIVTSEDNITGAFDRQLERLKDSVEAQKSLNGARLEAAMQEVQLNWAGLLEEQNNLIKEGERLQSEYNDTYDERNAINKIGVEALTELEAAQKGVEDAEARRKALLNELNAASGTQYKNANDISTALARYDALLAEAAGDEERLAQLQSERAFVARYLAEISDNEAAAAQRLAEAEQDVSAALERASGVTETYVFNHLTGMIDTVRLIDGELVTMEGSLNANAEAQATNAEAIAQAKAIIQDYVNAGLMTADEALEKYGITIEETTDAMDGSSESAEELAEDVKETGDAYKEAQEKARAYALQTGESFDEIAAAAAAAGMSLGGYVDSQSQFLTKSGMDIQQVADYWGVSVKEIEKHMNDYGVSLDQAHKDMEDMRTKSGRTLEELARLLQKTPEEVKAAAADMGQSWQDYGTDQEAAIDKTAQEMEAYAKRFGMSVEDVVNGIANMGGSTDTWVADQERQMRAAAVAEEEYIQSIKDGVVEIDESYAKALEVRRKFGGELNNTEQAYLDQYKANLQEQEDLIAGYAETFGLSADKVRAGIDTMGGDAEAWAARQEKSLRAAQVAEEDYVQTIKDGSVEIVESLALILESRRKNGDDLSAAEQAYLDKYKSNIKEQEELISGYAETYGLSAEQVREGIAAMNGDEEAWVADQDKRLRAKQVADQAMVEQIKAGNVEITAAEVMRIDALRRSGEELTAVEQAKLDRWQAINDEITASVEAYTDDVVNSFEKLPTRSKLSLDKMIANLKTNREQYAAWKENMKQVSALVGPELAAELETLGPAFNEELERALKQGGGKLLELLKEYELITADGVASVEEEFGSLDVTDEIDGAMDSATQAIDDKTGEMKQAGKDAADATGEGMEESTAPSDASQAIADAVVEDLANADYSGITGGIAAAITDGTSAVTSAAKGLTDAAGAQFKRMQTEASSAALLAVTAINSAIITRTAAVRSSTTALVNSIKDELQPMIEGGRTAAYSMMDGIISGLNSKTGDVYAKVREIAEQIVNTMKNSLQINSPSRVMIKLFEFAMLGIYKGMDGMEGMLYSKADDIADNLADRLTIQPDMADGLLARMRNIVSTNPFSNSPGMPSPAFAGAAAGTSYTTTLTQNITTPKPLSASEMTREGQDLLRRSKWQLP